MTLRGMARRVLATAGTSLVLTVTLATGLAHAADVSADSLFAEGTKALAEGRSNDAIADFEAVGDRGVVDPVVSFDRGLAYVTRVREHAEVPGDLGRAAHGFEEARELTDDSTLAKDASAALTLVRGEIARRRAHAGEPALLDENVPLPRAFARLATEEVWSGLAVVFAIGIGGALFARALLDARRGRIAATIVLASSFPALAACVAMALVARYDRLHRQDGIVITPSARLADERHIVIGSLPPLSEGTRVALEEAAAGFVRVHGAGTDGWLPASSVRILAKRD